VSWCPQINGFASRARSLATHSPCEPRCAQPVVRFSMALKSSYMAMAIAPTTTKPENAKPICMAEPAEISR